MGDLLGPGNDADLVNRSDLGTQPAVDAEDLAVDDGREDQEVEDVAASLPHRRVPVLLLALLVEPVDLRDLARLVVPSDEDDSVGVSALIESALDDAMQSKAGRGMRPRTLLLDTLTA